MRNIKVQTRDGPREIRIPTGAILITLAIIILAMLVYSSVYTIQANELGVVQRFGKLHGAPTEPGLHFKLPFGIDKVTPVRVQYVYKVEFGLFTEAPGITTKYARPSPELERVSLMLTGDLNCVVVPWIVQYKINKPADYLFNVRDPKQTLRDMSESIMREVVGDRSVHDVITEGKEEIHEEVKVELQKVLDKYKSGIQITQVILKDVNPPKEVKASFNEVNMARQEREELINQADKERRKAINEATGEAKRMIGEAEGYGQERVNQANGEVARFREILKEYKKAPDITRKRLYLETMAKVLPKIKRKVILDEEARSVLPLLNLTGEGRSP